MKPLLKRALSNILIATTLLAGGACAEPLEFADWIIEPPEGTPLREYAPVSISERDPNAIRLVEDLIIGADMEDPDTGVFRPRDVVATGDGTIFVSDTAANRVQMFDRDGKHLKTLGGTGQGPGEFSSIVGMTIAGDLLLIDDPGNRRFSAWTLDGNYVREYRRQGNVATRGNAILGLADGTVIGHLSIREGEVETGVVAHLSVDGDEMARLDEVALAPFVIPESARTPRGFGQWLISRLEEPARATVVGAGKLVYLSALDEYQVLALSPTGDPLWALRVAWPRPGVSAGTKEQVVSRAARGDGGLKADDLEWPAEDRTIARILTDRIGRLYVIPNVYFADQPPDRVPVDVYSADGELVAAGFMPARWPEPPSRVVAPWSYAAGEYVYGLREDDDGEVIAVRYRLLVQERSP